MTSIGMHINYPLELTQIHLPLSSGWQLTLKITAALVIVILALIILGLWLRGQRDRARYRYRVEITNQGNIRSRYELQVNEGGTVSADAPRLLKFDFKLNGAHLYTKAESDILPQSTHSPQAQGQPQVSTSSTQREGTFHKNVDRISRVSYLIGDMLSTVGYLLPHSIGGPISRMSMRVRTGGYTARRVEYISERVNTLRDEKAQPSGGSTSSSQAQASSPASATHTQVITGLWTQMPFVHPGKTLTIDMFVTPKNPYKDRLVPYKLISRSTEQTDAPVLVTEDTIHITGFGPLKRYGPFLVVLVGVILAIRFAFSIITRIS